MHRRDVMPEEVSGAMPQATRRIRLAAVTVFLVGAGPGDPGLLTVRGAEVLALADVVVHDRLSATSLVDLAPAGAQRINVGMAPDGATMNQGAINALLVELGGSGRTIVRLSDGDPFVFASGGEEATALISAAIPFEVIPGITPALAVPAYAGIPLTLHHSSALFTVVNGQAGPSDHDDANYPTQGDGSVDWEAVAQVGGTIVILRGVARWPAIAERLIVGGLDPATPAAAIHSGTRPAQASIRATLSTLANHAFASPSVIVVGRVAAESLDWFENRPLFGRSVVVTRARSHAGSLAGRLRSLGAEVVESPAIAIDDPDDGGVALHAAAGRLTTGEYSWVAFTSANGVDRTFAELPDARAFGGVQVAAVGPGTARALRTHGIVADLVPTVAVGEHLVGAFPSGKGRVLLPQAAAARDVVARGLTEKGWTVDMVDAYRSVPVVPDATLTARIAAADAVTFTSTSTVDNLIDVVGVGGLPGVVVSIGPVTTRSLEARGLSSTVEASPHTLDGLVAAVLAALSP